MVGRQAIAGGGYVVWRRSIGLLVAVAAVLGSKRWLPGAVWPQASTRSSEAISIPCSEAPPLAIDDREEAEILPGLVGAVRQAFAALAEKQCDKVFAEVDHDGSGTLDSAEVHVAVLLVYGRLNEILGSMALKAPRTAEVKALLRDSDVRGDDGQLDRDEFKRIFARRFMQRIAARAGARLLTKKVLVPLGGIGLNLASEHFGLSDKLTEKLGKLGKEKGAKALVANSIRRMVASKVLAQVGPAVGPLVNMQLSGALLEMLRVERMLAQIFGDKAAERVVLKRQAGEVLLEGVVHTSVVPEG